MQTLKGLGVFSPDDPPGGMVVNIVGSGGRVEQVALNITEKMQKRRVEREALEESKDE